MQKHTEGFFPTILGHSLFSFLEVILLYCFVTSFSMLVLAQQVFPKDDIFKRTKVVIPNTVTTEFLPFCTNETS